MRAAYRQLGWDAAWTPISDGEIMDALRAYELEHGRPPTVSVWWREQLRPGASVIIRRHGSWRPGARGRGSRRPVQSHSSE
jgi:hypothetical protein